MGWTNLNIYSFNALTSARKTEVEAGSKASSLQQQMETVSVNPLLKPGAQAVWSYSWSRILGW